MKTERRVPFKRRLRYHVDNALSHGIAVVMLWVLATLSAVILVIALLLWLLNIGPGGQSVPFHEALWISLTRSLDPGTFGMDNGHGFRLATLIISIIGIFAVAVIIGLVSNAIDRRLDHLRRGKSLVIEEGHSLILGYSTKLPIVIRELIEANASHKGHAIVVLTSKDKVELDELLHREIQDRASVRIIVRRGEPSALADLQQVRPEFAKSIVILRPDEHGADAEVVKVVLAVMRVRAASPEVPVVAEFESATAARAIRQAIPQGVTTLVSKEIVARVAAQTSRGSGLGAVYQDLLDFEGDEFYITPAPAHLVGRTFGEALLCSSNSMLVGVQPQGEEARLTPAFDSPICATDSLVFLAEDESILSIDEHLDGWVLANQVKHFRAEEQLESTLVLGWNPVADRILEEIDRHVLPGSRVHVLLDDWIEHEELEGCRSHLQNLKISSEFADTIDADVISQVMAMGPFNHILVLCAHRQISVAESDARALLTLMHVRNYLSTHDDVAATGHRTNVVAEVLESQSVELAQIASPDDFIVSQRLVSLLIAQLSENPRLKSVLQDILDSRGTRVAMQDAAKLGLKGDYSCRELVSFARDLGLVFLGWRTPSQQGAKYLTGGIRLNPHKDERVNLTDGSSIITLAAH